MNVTLSLIIEGFVFFHCEDQVSFHGPLTQVWRAEC